TMEPVLSSSAVIVVSLIASVMDARTGRIPNWLTLPAAALGVALGAIRGGGSGVIASLIGLLVAAVIPWALHRATRGRAIGGGDVKLFAALGALVGPLTGLEIELSAFVLLAVFGLARLTFQGSLARVLLNALGLLLNPLLPSKWRRTIEPEGLTEMRMGPAIAAAVLVV